MREDGYVSREEEQRAIEELPSVTFRPPGGAIKAPHFVMYVRDLLVKQFGEDVVENGGLKVTTTLDLSLQEKTEDIVSSEIEKVKNLDISNGAALAVNPGTGEILAMVGSRDFFSTEIDGQVNVTLRPRQPGSAIKPVTYVTAFRKGFTPAAMMVDAKTSFDSGDPLKPYEPVNYDGKFRGPVQLRFALGSSLNVPSVQLLQLVGLRDMLTMAHEMGISTLAPTTENMRRLGLSVTLGGGEVRLLDLVSAYSSFANGGIKVEPVTILKVEDSRGKTIYEYRRAKGRQVLSPQEAFLINHILSDNDARLLTFGVNSLLNAGE
jgi:membrane peptidoglycan carboxypeptidase